jgi:branched-chain amino acid transport system substrate-binding protein
MRPSLFRHLRSCLGIAGGLALAAALGATGARAEETGVTATSIKLGMVGPLTGPVSIYGYPINNGAIAVYKQVNDEGGIFGRKIEIVHEDDACDPAKARAAVKKLISRDAVFAVHGGSCSAATFATRDTFIEEKVPLMVMAATLDKISTPVSPYIFTAVPSGSVDGLAMIRFVASNPAIKTIAIVRHTDDWANAKLVAIRKEIESGKIKVVADEVIDRNATDATTQVLKVKEAKPDATLFVTYPGESAVFLRDAKKFGLAGPFIGTNSVMDLPDLAQRAGDPDTLKDVYVGAFLKGAIESASMKPYADMMQKYFPDTKIQSVNFYGMAGAYAVVDALKRAGKDLTREKFIAALNATKNLPAGPSYCNITFSAEDHQGCGGEQMWQMRDGKTIAIGDTWPKGAN